MSTYIRRVAILFLLVMGMFTLIITSQAMAQIQDHYGKLPLSFEANQGQSVPEVKFLSRGRGYTLFLTSTEATLVLSGKHRNTLQATQATGETLESAAILRMKFSGANTSATIVGQGKLPGRVNYFIGKHQNHWYTNVPVYTKVAYQNLYPGIDLVYYGNQQRLEYDFVIAPNAKPEAISLTLQGVENVDTGPDGLLLHTLAGDLQMHKPLAYQLENGVKRKLDATFVRKGEQQFGFNIANYDHTKPLIIDPVLVYSTYLGGNGDDSGNDIAIDPRGNAYIVGTTRSTNFPGTNALQMMPGGQSDAFVTKLNRDGTALVYSTYLGGSGNDEGSGIAVDFAGNVYLTGITTSPNFPTERPLQADIKGPSDAFVTKLRHDGTVLNYSTYLGGSNEEFDNFRSHYNIAVDFVGNAYVAGTTYSNDFPTSMDAYQRHLKGPNDAFVTKLNRSGSALLYSTYLGGSGREISLSIAVNGYGDAFIAGTIFSSPDFPTTSGAFQTRCDSDVVVAKLDRTGSNLIYSTCVGGSNIDFNGGIALDYAGNAYVTGNTVSSNFPVKNALQANFGGERDAYVFKLNRDGTDLVYSTYLGGNKADVFGDIAVDVFGNAYISGNTSSPDFPTHQPLQANCNVNFAGDCFDATVVKLNSSGSALLFSTFLGGSAADSGESIAVDIFGNMYVTGQTFDANDFPTKNPVQALLGGGRNDAFIVKINPFQRIHYYYSSTGKT